MDGTALNEKLAIFCGFTNIHVSTLSKNHLLATFPIIPNDLVFCEEIVGQLPNLVEYVDNQIKWLYPKLKIITKTNGYKDWTVSLNFGTGKIPCFIGEAKTESMALALAVEQYIDSLKEDNKG